MTDKPRVVIPDGEPLLYRREVAAIFRVDPRTVSRWATEGKLTSIRTPGGHRRFKRSECEALAARSGTPEEASDDHPA